MYEQFYHLRAEPFRLSPDHRFCFNHRSYAKAKAYMQYALHRAEGFVMITGRPGTGKTTLVNDLLDGLSRSQVTVAMLVTTQLEANDLLRMVAYSFGLDAEVPHKATILQNLTLMLTRHHRERKRALLIIDEAQDLSSSALEELRLLTNLQINNQPLLQIFLLGQEALRDLVQEPGMEQVHQRLVAACHLEPLKEEETRAYIKHRLERVGWRGDPAISEAIFPLIYKFSHGVPRRINLVCSRLFLHGSVEERHVIGVEDARIVIEELRHEQLMPLAHQEDPAYSMSEFDALCDDEFVAVPTPVPATPHTVPVENPAPVEAALSAEPPAPATLDDPLIVPPPPAMHVHPAAAAVPATVDYAPAPTLVDREHTEAVAIAAAYPLSASLAEPLDNTSPTMATALSIETPPRQPPTEQYQRLLGMTLLATTLIAILIATLYLVKPEMLLALLSSATPQADIGNQTARAPADAQAVSQDTHAGHITRRPTTARHPQPSATTAAEALANAKPQDDGAAVADSVALIETTEPAADTFDPNAAPATAAGGDAPRPVDDLADTLATEPRVATSSGIEGEKKNWTHRLKRNPLPRT